MADSNSVPLWVPLVTAALTFLGTAGGYISAQVVESNRAKRELRAREEERRTALFDRRTQFQRETLLALQQAVLELGQIHGHINFFDIKNLRETGKRQPLPEDLNQSAQDAFTKTAILGVRVSDEEARKLLKEFKDYLIGVVMGPEQFDRNAALSNAFGIGDKLNLRIGFLLRELDSAEIARETKQNLFC